MRTRAPGPRIAGVAIACLIGLGGTTPALAGLDEGISAYEAGEFEAAMGELKPLADQGNPQAQYVLGRMYAQGQGTLKNYSLAHTYLTLAANQGVTDALFEKADISDNLSQRDIIESLKRQNEMLLNQQAGVQQALVEPQIVRDDEEEVAVAQPAEDDIARMDRRELVRSIQEQLNRLGYSAGTPDGLYGPSTAGAIQNYQRDAGLTTDGEATADLLRSLRAAEPG